MHIKLLIHLHRLSDDLRNQLSQILVKVLYQLAEEIVKKRVPSYPLTMEFFYTQNNNNPLNKMKCLVFNSPD